MQMLSGVETEEEEEEMKKTPDGISTNKEGLQGFKNNPMNRGEMGGFLNYVGLGAFFQARGLRLMRVGPQLNGNNFKTRLNPCIHRH